MDQPPVKRYKARDRERKDFVIGSSTRLIALTARQIKISEEATEMQSHDKTTLTGEEKKKAIGILRGVLLRYFMDSHQIYFTVEIVVDSGVVLEALFFDHAKVETMSELALSATGIEKNNVKTYVEDEEREALCTRMPLDTLYHIDDLDYWVDELITKHEVIFYFQEDANAFLREIRDKPTSHVTNLEMQYLRQLKAEYDSAISRIKQ